MIMWNEVVMMWDDVDTINKVFKWAFLGTNILLTSMSSILNTFLVL